MRKRSGTAWSLTLAVALSTMASLASAQAPIQTFYVPVPEAGQLSRLSAPRMPALADTSIRTTIGITAAGDDTILYYDHWEDGYETRHLEPGAGDDRGSWGTRTWRTERLRDVSSTPATWSNAGDVFTLQNDVFANPRDPATILYDGRDKIASTLLVAVTRAAWPTPNVNRSSPARWKSFPRTTGERIYEAPGGEGFSAMFDDARFVIMAQRANTIVRIDVNDDGRRRSRSDSG